jgi:hypothetical protein
MSEDNVTRLRARASNADAANMPTVAFHLTDGKLRGTMSTHPR